MERISPMFSTIIFTALATASFVDKGIVDAITKLRIAYTNWILYI